MVVWTPSFCGLSSLPRGGKQRDKLEKVGSGPKKKKEVALNFFQGRKIWAALRVFDPRVVLLREMVRGAIGIGTVASPWQAGRGGELFQGRVPGPARQVRDKVQYGRSVGWYVEASWPARVSVDRWIYRIAIG